MLLISDMLSECRQLSGEIYDVLLFLSPYTKWLYLQDCSIFSSFIPIILPSMLKPYSLYNNNLNLKMTDCEFNQWFAGFTDGEANFAIVISNNIISFKYSVKLHIDHLNTLKFIKSRLGCGNIIINSKSNSASFELNRIGDIQTKLITRLDKFSLNGIKFLDYLTFKEGISIKLDESISKSEKFERIAELKNSMNNKRTNLAMPITHEVNITPYWLLGLIEGEGTFCLKNPKTMSITFYLSLTIAQKPLILAIKNFLDYYVIGDTYLKSTPEWKEIVNQIWCIYERDKRKKLDKPQIEITINQIKFIHEKFVPFLSNLVFVTKKHKDFLDWAFIASLIYKGKHTTEAGRELILKISKGMNNYRLSTNKSPFLKKKLLKV